MPRHQVSSVCAFPERGQASEPVEAQVHRVDAFNKPMLFEALWAGQNSRQPVSSNPKHKHASWAVQILMTLIGLVRVTCDTRDVERQHDALDPICTRVFEETASGRHLVKNRPELRAALHYLDPNDVLVVTKVNHLAQSTIDGVVVLNDLFEQGLTVKVLEGIAAGDHVERSSVLDMGRDISEIRRGLVSRRVKAGLMAARERGTVGGRPRVVDRDKCADILLRREQGESLRSIAQSLGVAVGTVHNVLANAKRM
jgi:DNA invertase Pin-like site-specific DNA recombinase